MTIRVLPAVAAYAAGVQVATLRQWVRRGRINGPDEDGCYDLVEIERYCAQRDSRNFHRALAGRRRRGEQRASLRDD